MSAAGLPELLGAITVRSDQIVGALSECSGSDLRSPSLLPGWDRLTIACHLRYGAEALTSMTQATLAGEPASYYPGGRARQRPVTLRPRPGEDPVAVVGSLSQVSDQLAETWRPLAATDWRREVREPDDNRDLGPLELARLPLLRLTEVEVHGTDLDLGLPDWSGVFVRTALAFRVQWLNTRRANHRAFDEDLAGSWVLAAVDGPSHEVIVDGEAVETQVVDHDDADAVIRGSSRDLLALLLGRPTLEPLTFEGDPDFAAAFTRAFPGP